MEKLQIQNMGLPQYPKILYTEYCVYFSDNRALPQVLTCGKRIVSGHSKDDSTNGKAENRKE